MLSLILHIRYYVLFSYYFRIQTPTLHLDAWLLLNGMVTRNFVERTPSSGKVTTPLAITQHKTHALNRQFSRRTHSKQCYKSGTPSATQRSINSNPFQNHSIVVIIPNSLSRVPNISFTNHVSIPLIRGFYRLDNPFLPL